MIHWLKHTFSLITKQNNWYLILTECNNLNKISQVQWRIYALSGLSMLMVEAVATTVDIRRFWFVGSIRTHWGKY